MNINNIKVNEEYEKLVPPLSKEDYTNLKESIIKDGVLYPVIINQEKVLLDGHHRLKICKENNIQTIETIFKTFPNQLDEKEFVISSNLNRRHLTTAQKADMGLEILDIEREKAKQRQGERTDLKPSNIVQNSVQSEVINNKEDNGKAVKIAARKAGVSHDTLQRANKIKKASKKDPQINKRWEQAKQGKTSINSVYRDVKRKEKKEEIKTIPKKELEGKFNVFYVDPPWEYSTNASLGRGTADEHYPTMSIEKLQEMEIKPHTLNDAVLFLWTTNTHIQDAFKVMESWGFTYKTNMVWVKDRIGTGLYFRGKHEILLVGIKGSFQPFTTKLPESVLLAPREQHSKKPIIIYDIIEQMYPGQKYVELFARNKRDGWTSWGNEL